MSAPLREVFEGRSVFVTGHTGFKGSWLCLWLNHLGAHVHGYSLPPPTTPSNFEVSNVRDVLASHRLADVRDAGALQRAMHAAQPDVVLHLAAQSVVGTGYELPGETFDTNVMGTVCVLDAVASLARDCAVVVVTSDKAYQNREQVWGYRECDPFGDYDPYGASKGAAELVVRSYRKSFFSPARIAEHGVRLASARAGNVIGGGDWTQDALLVDMLAAFRAGRPVELRHPHACRPWQHVLQALSGYLAIAARLLGPQPASYCDGFNIGPEPGAELSVVDAVALFADVWGGGTWRDASDPEARREANILRLNIDKARWQLGWRPVWDVRETFARAAEWYRREDAGEAMQAVCLAQIADFEADFEAAQP